MIAHPSPSTRLRTALMALVALALGAALFTGTAAAAEGTGKVTLSFKSEAKAR